MFSCIIQYNERRRDIALRKFATAGTNLQGHSNSSMTTIFDRSYITAFLWSTVTVGLYVSILQRYRDISLVRDSELTRVTTSVPRTRGRNFVKSESISSRL